MVTLLRRLFVKDYLNVTDPSVRSAHGVLAAVWGIVTNLLLVGLKLGVAIYLASRSGWVFSMALIAESVNNLSDLASNAVTLVGFRLAKKPADKEHPFGHRRVEYVAGLVVAVFVLVAAVELFLESLKSALGGVSVYYDTLALIILAVSVLVKLGQGLVNLGLAKAIDSLALKTTAKDSFLDAIATTVVLIGGIIAGALTLGQLDSYLGLAVSLFLGVSGVRMIIEEANPLIGMPNDGEAVERIAHIALGKPEVFSVHDVLCHEYGPGMNFVSLHVVVDEGLSLVKAHEIADSIEEDIHSSLGYVATVHVDPEPMGDEALARAKEFVSMTLREISPELSFHDLRLTKDGIRLDVQTPYGFKDEEAVLDRLKARYQSVEVTFDHPTSE